MTNARPLTMLLRSCFYLTLMLFVTSSMGRLVVICPPRCTCLFPDVDGNNIIDCADKGLVDIPDLAPLLDLTIHRLILNVNTIAAIPKGIFSGLRIHWMEIDNNNFESISGEDFTGLEESLEFLSLRGNAAMTSFDGASLGRFKRLRTLNLVGMGAALNVLKPMFLGDIPSLEVLLLSSNHIGTISDDAFKGLDNLRELAVDECKLTGIPPAVVSLINLLDLSMSNNEIQTLDQRFLHQLTELQVLDLSLNRGLAAALTEGAFAGLDLQTLNLSFCGLEMLPNSITKELRQLKSIDLRGNGDLVLTGSEFTHMNNLKQLDLSYVPLPADKDYLVGLEHTLDTLILQGCDLTEVPAVQLVTLRSLRRVDLGGNSIQELREEDFMDTTATEWSLDNNDIQFVDNWAFLDVAMPMFLDLSYNRIEASELGFLETSCVGGEVKLNNNPLVCECDLWATTQRRNLHVEGTCTGQYGTMLVIGGSEFRMEMTEWCENDTPSTECTLQWLDEASDGWSISFDYTIIVIQCLVFLLLIATM